ncbi:MAG TPA: glycosyltransferase family A protein [Vicinamibacterales bacterium]|nr:glycosyltransferase family A protein [Vicinamibacterales bacterium]
MRPRAAVSVIMINRNGGSYLAPALATCRVAIEHALPLEPRIEFVIVDNGSTDNPLPVIERELAGAPFDWRVVPESRLGVNSSRNAGIAGSTGDLLLFVDSDLEFDHGWLRAFVAASRSHPSARVFAGRVRVGKLEAPPPAWLPIDGPLVRTSIVVRCEYGDDVRELPIDDAHGPVGPNMGFRRDIFKEFGTFDTRFGLRPGSLVPGAESEFFDRLARAGMRFVYVPDAAVNHPLRASQMTRAYFSQRLRGIGRATSRLRRVRGERPRRVCGLTLYVVRQLATATGRWLYAAVSGASPAERAYARGNVDLLIGYLQEDFIAWRDSVTTPDTRGSGNETQSRPGPHFAAQ